MLRRRDGMDAAPEGAWRAALALLGWVMIIPAISQTVLIPALPDIAHRMHAGPTAVAWTLTAYLLTASVGAPVVGRLGDLYGPRRVMRITLLLYAAGSVVCVLAGSIEVLVAGRALQGLIGGVFVLGLSVVRREFPAARVPASVGLLSVFIGIGTGAGFLIGGTLVAVAGLHAIFWMGLFAGGVGALLCERLVPETSAAPGGRVDVWGAALLAVGVTLPLVAVSQANRWGLLAPGTLAFLAVGALVLRAWVTVERRTADPLVDIASLSLPTVRLANLATLCFAGGMFGLFVLTPELGQEPRTTGYGFGLDAAGAGLLLLPGAVAMLVAGPLSSTFGRRVGDRVPLAVGTGLAAVGLGLLALEHGSVTTVVALTFVASAGVGIAYPAMPNIVGSAVHPSQFGEAAGVNAMVRGIGSSIGAQVAVAILASSAGADAVPTNAGYATAFLVAAGLAGGAALIALAIPAVHRHPAAIGGDNPIGI